MQLFCPCAAEEARSVGFVPVAPPSFPGRARERKVGVAALRRLPHALVLKDAACSRHRTGLRLRERGIIIAGVAPPRWAKEYVLAITHLAEALKFPVLAEGLSPVRNYAHLNPNIISTYDIILRNEQLAEKLAPEIVIQIGDFPTSKQLRAWLTEKKPPTGVIEGASQFRNE
ncbi:MAG: hypothetical protein EBE86_023255 [Hormoscilla sp. GUM202]|nr:hypothetical protein [Hormoscilla sp. GUM202]